MDLTSAFKNYLFSQDKKPSKVTVKNYLSDINHFIRWFESKYSKPFSPQEVNRQTIEGFKLDNTEAFSASSLERHFSSLRKFFYFLKLEGKISSDPFKPLVSEANASLDPWHIKDFKSFLYVYNASHLTIKNYIIDIKQFLTWAEEVTGVSTLLNRANENVLGMLTPKLIEEYKQRLIGQGNFSPATINRKLSSLRKYTLWATDEGLIRPFEAETLNIQDEKEPKIRSLEAQIPAFTQFPIADQGKEYSKFPPLRLFQKVSKAAIIAFDAGLIVPLAKGLEKAEYVLWQAKGKPIFEKAKKIRLPKQISHEDLLGIKNISKEFYAPLEISTKGFTWYKKAWFTLRYYRPNWYKKYHSYAIAHYFNFAILVIFIVGLGLGFYNGFLKSGNQPPTLAAGPTAPPRVLSFQGRLTDSNDNPITSPTNLRFIIYDTLAATGSSRLWEEVDQVVPDGDGIFNVIMGNGSACNGGLPPSSPATGPCQIPQSLFANNAALYLGVTVEWTPELTPRQQLATVAYATNAEVLQGMPPTTQAGLTSYKNVVLALDSNGNFNLNDTGVTDHVFQAGNGALKLTGQPLLLTTNVGSNGNVQIGPDGSGRIDLVKPLVNTQLSNNISTAVGSVEVDDTFSILASSSGQSALTINETGSNAPLISASASGANRFAVDNSGNIRVAAGTTIDTFTAGSLGLGTTTANAVSVGNSTASLTLTSSGITVNQNSVLYSGSSGVVATANTATSNLCLISGATTPSWSNCLNGLNQDAFWSQTLGSLYPNNSTADLLVGGQSTNSARFRVIANNFGAGTLGVASISGKTSFAALVVNNDGVGDLFAASSSAQARFTIKGNGSLIANAYQTCTLKTDANGLVTCGVDNLGSSPFSELAGSIVA
ncbi:MAG TPA: site-specific integrase, partial [Candidatus Sulfotelmatobacter sp.]|nr:site-specific integrase [Candidatus Sulfotelmatobacter sp.]